MRKPVNLPLLLKDGRMGKKIVVEIQCDRCTRVEHKEVTGKEKDDDEPILVASFLGEKTVFRDLCGACTDIVTARWTEIARELTKASPQREKNKEKKE